MKDTKRQVFENQALAPLTRKLGEVLVPNPIRWTHEERETMLEGKTGYGKLGFGEPRWAHATSKPFGSVFKPKRPNEDVRFEKPKPSPKIRSLRELREASEKLCAAQPPKLEVITCVEEGNFNPNDWQVKVAKKCIANALQLEEFVKDKVITKAEPSKEGVVTKEKRRTCKVGLVGLDKVRKVKPEPMPAWQREKEERGLLVQYWMLLRSIYGQIYS